MDALIEISSSEFNEELFKRIESLIKVLVTVKLLSKSITQKVLFSEMRHVRSTGIE